MKSSSSAKISYQMNVSQWRTLVDGINKTLKEYEESELLILSLEPTGLGTVMILEDENGNTIDITQYGNW
jgi:hypothetical protein